MWGETTMGETTRGELVLGRNDLLPPGEPKCQNVSNRTKTNWPGEPKYQHVALIGFKNVQKLIDKSNPNVQIQN